MAPRYTDIVPSVTTMGGRRSFQTSSPLTAPSAAPHAVARSTSGHTPSSAASRLTLATIMPQSARFAATDRSIPRTMMTSICPSASITRMAPSSQSSARLRGVAKPGNAMLTPTASASVNAANTRVRRASAGSEPRHTPTTLGLSTSRWRVSRRARTPSASGIDPTRLASAFCAACAKLISAPVKIASAQQKQEYWKDWADFSRKQYDKTLKKYGPESELTKDAREQHAKAVKALEDSREDKRDAQKDLATDRQDLNKATR